MSVHSQALIKYRTCGRLKKLDVIVPEMTISSFALLHIVCSSELYPTYPVVCKILIFFSFCMHFTHDYMSNT